MSKTTPAAQQSASEEGEEGFLDLRHLRKTFDDGSIVAVEDFNVSVRQGEFLVMVGPSGCGKSTTLRMIAGLEEPDSGEIVIDGRDVAGKEARERDIAMVFQSYALYPHMTVRENMAYPLKVRGQSKSDRARNVEETAELLQITDLLDRKPGALSGGQQQRVALGRALVREPQVFLLDEPLSNLDQKLRVQMRTELNRLHDAIGKTSVYVTHDQAEAMTLGDRIVVMNDGNIQQVDPPQTIYHEPANMFVGGFIGEPEMNFFDVDIDVDAQQLETGSFTLDMTDQMVAAVEEYDLSSERATFGIRPEHISLESNVYRRETHEGNTAEAEVLVVETMGDEKHLTIKGDGKEYQAIVEGDSEVQQGETYPFVFHLERAHIFDSETGENLLYGQ